MKSHDYEKRKKRINIIISIIVACLMIASIGGYAILNNSSSTNDATYGDYNFKIVQSSDGSTVYRTSINGKYQDFLYFPSEVSRINITSEVYNKIKNSQAIIITFDPNETSDNLVFIDIMRYNLQNKVSKPIYFGVTNTSSTYPLQVISCANATNYMPFLLLNISATTSIVANKENPNCIILNGKLRDITALSDRMAYILDDVMKE